MRPRKIIEAKDFLQFFKIKFHIRNFVHCWFKQCVGNLSHTNLVYGLTQKRGFGECP